MASEPVSFREILDWWESREAAAVEMGVTGAAVSKWWQRDFIPAVYWSRLLDTAPASVRRLTAERLARLAAIERVSALQKITVPKVQHSEVRRPRT